MDTCAIDLKSEMSYIYNQIKNCEDFDSKIIIKSTKYIKLEELNSLINQIENENLIIT